MPSEPVTVVVPTYREAENIPILAERLFAALASADIAGEMIIVDDDSRDGTVETVADLAQARPIRLITRIGERGLSSAVVRGFNEARHDLLLCMDADLSHPPEAVPDMLRRITDGGAEFCIGSRYVEGGTTNEDWGLLRHVNSWGATLLAKPLTPARDPMAGFFCLRRSTFARAVSAGLNPIGYKIALEIAVKARCKRIAEVPIEFSDRLHGQSKLSLRQQLLYLKHLLHLYRFRWPQAMPVAVICALACVIGGAFWAIRR